MWGALEGAQSTLTDTFCRTQIHKNALQCLVYNQS